jgi:LacI family transcriptional regulator
MMNDVVFPKIGIVANNVDGVFQQAVIAGITQTAVQNGYNVIVSSYGGSGDSKNSSLAAAIPELAGVRGLVAIANAAPDDLLQSTHRSKIPVSLVAHQIAGSAIPSVMSNNAQGIAELVRHLVAGCHRRNLVFIRGLRDQSDARERELIFRQELNRYDLYVPESHFLRGDFVPEVAAASLHDLIQQDVPFDGIIAADYMMGIAAVEALRHSKVKVPDHVSVVSFGDGVEAEAAGLTTAAASVNEMGACAARQLISQINGLSISGVTTLSVRLVVRETCGYKAGETVSA